MTKFPKIFVAGVRLRAVRMVVLCKGVVKPYGCLAVVYMVLLLRAIIELNSESE